MPSNAAQTFVQQVANLYPLMQPNLRKTPLIRSDYYSKKFGCHLYLKLENLQYTGAFKLRGALAKALSLSEKERSKGFIAASAGNHGMGVAKAAGMLGVKAKIFVPVTTPDFKVRKIVQLGGEPVLKGEDWFASNEAALLEEKKSGMTYFHPFADEDVMRGQATIALEVLAEAPQTDIILASIGGGGLISGIARYAKGIKNKIHIYGVETAGAPGMSAALAADEAVTLHEVNTAADSIAVRRVADNALQYVKDYVTDVVTVEDDEALHAQIELLQQAKQLAEPAASCCLAAIEKGLIPKIKNKHVVVVICGANWPVEKLPAAIARDVAVAYKINKPALHELVRGFGLKVKDSDPAFEKFFREVKKRELDGYAYGEAPASLEILAKQFFKKMPDFFQLKSYRVLEERIRRGQKEETVSEAVVRIEINHATQMAVAESGSGPVSALAQALHKLLDPVYPQLQQVQLTDYRVRILTPHAGTEAVTRVMIESRDAAGRVWMTVGISADIISASYEALVESYWYYLLQASPSLISLPAGEDRKRLAQRS